MAGRLVRGHRVASGQAADSPYPGGTIRMQTPFFKALGLDLTPFYDATLNVSLHPYTFAMRRPAYTFRHVEWTTRHPPEDFSFAHCRLVVNGVRYAGWVYYPHPETKKAHFQNPSIVEIIAPFIPDLSYGDPLELWIRPDEITIEPGPAASETDHL